MRNYGKIDLHLHLDGSLSVRSVRELAAMQAIEIPKTDSALLDLLQVGEDCKDLNEYLEKFAFPCSLLQTREAITKSVANLTAELAEHGLLYAEIRFAPQLHTLQGLTQEEVVRAAIAGLNGDVLPANLILCCMRGVGNEDQNLETIRVAGKFLGRGVCAVDLAGAEALFPTANFEGLFSLAVQLGIPYTIHAGEADGPDSVRTALKYGAVRLGHGVRSVEEPALLERLARDGVTLELCPTSNLNTSIFADIRDYPLPALLDAGIRVTINTDNMTVSGVTLASEMEKVRTVFFLSDGQMQALVFNAVEASFAPESLKEQLRAQLDAVFSE